MLPIAGDGKFISIGDKIRFPDDVTMGFIIGKLITWNEFANNILKCPSNRAPPESPSNSGGQFPFPLGTDGVHPAGNVPRPSIIQLRPDEKRMEHNKSGRIRFEKGSKTVLLTSLSSVSVFQFLSAKVILRI